MFSWEDVGIQNLLGTTSYDLCIEATEVAMCHDADCIAEETRPGHGGFGGQVSSVQSM